MTGVRTEEQVREQRIRRATARHRCIVFAITDSVCATFGQPHAEIDFQISRSEMVRNEGDRRLRLR
jgi:hypothetical protein